MTRSMLHPVSAWAGRTASESSRGVRYMRVGAMPLSDTKRQKAVCMMTSGLLTSTYSPQARRMPTFLATYSQYPGSVCALILHGQGGGGRGLGLKARGEGARTPST